jgi:hypothetical protein
MLCQSVGKPTSKETSDTPFIVHQPNLPSGGKISRIELADFLSRGYGPEQQSLLKLIARDLWISHIRLSDKTSRLHPRHVVPKPPPWWNQLRHSLSEVKEIRAFRWPVRVGTRSCERCSNGNGTCAASHCACSGCWSLPVPSDCPPFFSTSGIPR